MHHDELTFRIVLALVRVQEEFGSTVLCRAATQCLLAIARVRIDEASGRAATLEPEPCRIIRFVPRDERANQSGVDEQP